jgi:hypothetical protein
LLCTQRAWGKGFPGALSRSQATCLYLRQGGRKTFDKVHHKVLLPWSVTSFLGVVVPLQVMLAPDYAKGGCLTVNCQDTFESCHDVMCSHKPLGLPPKAPRLHDLKVRGRNPVWGTRHFSWYGVRLNVKVCIHWVITQLLPVIHLQQ